MLPREKISEKIQKYLQELPTSLQAEVLDFVEYLKAKADREPVREECRDWSGLSLYSAMRGMEHEDSPVYALSEMRTSRTAD